MRSWESESFSQAKSLPSKTWMPTTFGALTRKSFRLLSWASRPRRSPISIVSIRRATLEDVPSLMAITDESVSAGHWTEKQYQSALTDTLPRRVLLVFTDLNTIRGFVVAAEIAREWELENIAVRNSGRRQGTSDQLMEARLKELQSSRAECLHLEVRESNTPARTLYEKWGFRVSGRRTRYYHNPSEDAILYRKNLSPAAPEIR